jgi:hypothetical protein
MVESFIVWSLQVLATLADKLMYLVLYRFGKYAFSTMRRIARYLDSPKNPLLKGDNHVEPETRLNILIQRMDEELDELLGDKRQIISELIQSGATSQEITQKHFDYCLAIVGVFFVHAVNICIYAKSATKIQCNSPKRKRKP